MTLRIEKIDEDFTPTIRLIGRIQSEQLSTLRAQLEQVSRPVTIDLAEVTNLDVEAVRFLGACELEGLHLLNCSPFIREWIKRERQTAEGQ